MTTISIKCRRSGFTLVEIMVSVAILSMVMASLTGTFLVFLKGSASVGFYSQMSSESRKGLELFARDVRGADGITVATPQTEDGFVISRRGIILTYPSYVGSKTVRYSYDGTNDELTRSLTVDGVTTSEVLFSGLENFKLTFFQTPGANFSAISGPAASVDTWTKSIQMDAELVRYVAQLENTDYIISARFMLRNY